MHIPNSYFETYKGDEPYIFISYAHKDSQIVYPIINDLHEAGYRIWYDEGIDPGNEWPDEIARALKKSAFFLVFISQNSMKSKNVIDECNLALNKLKPFVAIHIEETELTDGLELRASSTQAIMKYRMDKDSFMKKICSVLDSNSRKIGVLKKTKDTNEDVKDTENQTDEPATNYIIGINLGNSNTRVAEIDYGVIPNSEGERSTPTIVAFTESRQSLIGKRAKKMARSNPNDTIRSIKRAIGTDKKYLIRGKYHTPEEIYSKILRQVKADAEHYLGSTVDTAVLTIPVCFGCLERQALHNSARSVGLEIARMISEPTAAALAYFMNNQVDEQIMICDLGSGSFDVSISEYGDGVLEVLSTSGSIRLGGDDFDERIIHYLINEFQRIEGIDLSLDPIAIGRIAEAAENAKKDLSNISETNIVIPYIATSEDGIKDLDVMFSIVQFMQLTKDLVEQAVQIIKLALIDAHVGVFALDKIIMLGGSSRIPALQEAIRALTGKKVIQSMNFEEYVAIGAGIIGGKLKGHQGTQNILLIDSTPHSIGIETLGGITTSFVKRNESIPTRHTQLFSTTEDDQTQIDLLIVEGERTLAKDNKTVGRLRVEGITPAKKGIPKIEISISFDANMTIVVSAKLLGSDEFLIYEFLPQVGDFKDFGKYGLVLIEDK